MSEQTERQRKILETNQRNADILQRLAAAGVEIDPTGKRTEMFMERLVTWGVISKDQLEEFDLAWVEHFNEYLVKLEVDLRAASEKDREERRTAQAARKLGVTPQSPGIIVPGHGRGKNGSGRRGRG